ncbi:MAG: penicillin-binding protein 1C [Nitrospirae bacterium GWC2_57_13]|nr:MAG: penicillin-binding protein 1C [Nitrospirae bacterium GWC2_57_13]OGW45470.1 MAG: penicillin-binding protein 1C [Nitrospirae bacterium GWD2_57_8]HAR46728.1 penicillin-binding protein 1C [Nitrospiraceae bacterium]
MRVFRKYRAFLIILASVGIMLVLGVGGMLFAMRSEARKHPIYAADVKPFHSLRIADRNGVLLQEVRSRDGRSAPVRLRAISPHFIHAVLAAEDRRFRSHSGVDWLAVGRAGAMNILSVGRRSGASTITLQLAKMLDPGPRTLGKKIREVKGAWRIEAGMTKDEILEQYMSRLPFGNQLFGIESASQDYFRKKASDLSLAQAALLAAIPNAPTLLNPRRNLDLVNKRRTFILDRMHSLGYISREEKELAQAERIEIHEPARPRSAPHFIERLQTDLPAPITRVTATLNARLQAAVEQQVKEVIDELKGRVVTNAAVLVLENRTGEVLAYVGSADFDDHGNEGQNDGVQALRQPGSALKPFIYGLALEKGMSPATMLDDLEVHFSTPVGDFSPQNYSRRFHGPVRLREALGNSLNVPAVRVIAELGTDAALARLRDFGFQTLDADAEHYGVGLILGDGEVTLYELTRAYMYLARGGSIIPVREVLVQATAIMAKGRQSDGEREKRMKSAPLRVSTPEAVYLITDILKDPYARTTEFGLDSVLRLPFPAAVKTGTSRNYRDNWTVGYTREYTVGVWVGNFNGVPMQQVAGVSGAGPIFRRVMMLLQGKKEPKDFERPSGLIEVEVCALSGKQKGPDCPHGVSELFLRDEVEAGAMEPCDVHRKLPVLAGNGQIAPAGARREETEYRVFEDLPPIYEFWQRETGRPVMPRELSRHAESALFEIIRPAHQSIYRRPLDLAARYQTIRFEAVGAPGSAEVVWTLNSDEIGRTRDAHFLDWPVRTGEYRLRATAPGVPASEIRFTVE